MRRSYLPTLSKFLRTRPAFLSEMEFDENLCNAIQIPDNLPGFSILEGNQRLRYGLHHYRGRNAALIELKNKNHLHKTNYFANVVSPILLRLTPRMMRDSSSATILSIVRVIRPDTCLFQLS